MTAETPTDGVFLSPAPQLSQSEFEQLSLAIKKRTGLLLRSDKIGEFQKRLSAASFTSGIQNARDLIRNIESSPEALQNLVNLLTVGESYFFRNRPHFEALQRRIFPQLIEDAKRDRKLRIWSAGCARGEEPYSIAILLHKHFPMIREWDVLIEASDINTSFLQQAKQAIYPKWSLRGLDADLIGRYFVRTSDDRYRLDPAVKSRVTFTQHNLNDVNQIDASADRRWDLVLCRNVLIYFAHDAVQRTVSNIETGLRPGGYLLTGHSEALASCFGLELLYSDSTFYYRRYVPTREREKTAHPSLYRISIPTTDVRSMFPKAYVKEVVKITTPPVPRFSDRCPPRLSFHSITPQTSQTETTLEEAQRYADLGEIEKAYEILETVLLKGCPVDYRVYFLHAIIADQLGKPVESLRSLKQSIFLNRKFVIGHYYLGTIYEREGQHQEAKKHFRNVSRLLAGLENSVQIEDAEGLTVGRLKEITEARLKEMSL